MDSGRGKTSRSPLGEPALYDYAVRALGRQMRTEAELERLLGLRAGPGEAGREAVRAVLGRLREHGYLNDAAFAETYARLRRENDRLGQRRVRQALGRRGVDPGIAARAVDASYAGIKEEALVLDYLARKGLGAPANERETLRIMRRLLAAGFSAGAIASALRRWNVPEETLAVLEEQAGETGEDQAPEA